MSNYPTLDRIASVSEESNKIREFLEWLRAQGYYLAQYAEHVHTDECIEYNVIGRHEIKSYVCGYTTGDNFVPVSYTINSLLAKYYEIDENKAEQERRALLESLRNQ